MLLSVAAFLVRVYEDAFMGVVLQQSAQGAACIRACVSVCLAATSCSRPCASTGDGCRGVMDA
jgi:hypothetical protein